MMHRLIPGLLCLMLITGCAPRQDSELAELRAELHQSPWKPGDIFYDVIMNDPAALAARAVAAGDHRLVAVVIGYKAKEEKAKPVGVTCDEKTQSKTPMHRIAMGCVVPPTVVFHQMAAFNRAVIAQPGFPAAAGCAIDPKFDAEIRKWEQQLAADEKQRAERQLNK